MGFFVCGRMGRFVLTMKKVSILLVFITAIQADQEDGIIEVDLPFSQHQAPHSWFFLFVG